QQFIYYPKGHSPPRKNHFGGGGISPDSRFVSARVILNKEPTIATGSSLLISDKDWNLAPIWIVLHSFREILRDSPGLRWHADVLAEVDGLAREDWSSYGDEKDNIVDYEVLPLLSLCMSDGSVVQEGFGENLISSEFWRENFGGNGVPERELETCLRDLSRSKELSKSKEHFLDAKKRVRETRGNLLSTTIKNRRARDDSFSSSKPVLKEEKLTQQPTGVHHPQHRSTDGGDLYSQPKTTNREQFTRKGKISTLRNVIARGSRVQLIDGKHAGNRGTFQSWSGTVCYINIDGWPKKHAFSTDREIMF
ncbi:hypothetical protein PROFUN_16259, partial [Planoprotostelium fungivorum]